MNHDTIILYIIAIAALGFALFNAIQICLHVKKTALTTGTIASITMPNATSAKAWNSKWAKLSYDVNGKTYSSKNCIQVPMSSEIGTTITVRYNVQHPEKIYSFSLQRVVISALVSVICIVVAVFHLL